MGDSDVYTVHHMVWVCVCILGVAGAVNHLECYYETLLILKITVKQLSRSLDVLVDWIKSRY